jgi:hypothetical protein
MMNHNEKTDSVPSDEIRMDSLGSWFQFPFSLIFRNLLWIIPGILLGAVLGWLVSVVWPDRDFVATYTISTEEKNSSAWENLLAQFGMDVSGNSPANVFQGESLVKLFHTRSMIEKALITPTALPSGDIVYLGDYFFVRSKASMLPEFEGFQFVKGDSGIIRGYSSLQDSALWFTCKYVLEEVVSASRPEKKLTFIELNCDDRSDTMAMAMAGKMIQTVGSFYTENLTYKARRNLNVLQQELDSVKKELNKNMYQSSMLNDEDVNATRQVLRVDQNRKLIDLQISMTLFGELTKNIQLAEISLRKETPLIQIIDSPRLPLEYKGLNPCWFWAIGSGLGGMLAILLVLLRNPGVINAR